jgi:DinB family protein
MSEAARLMKLIDLAFTASRWHVQDLTDKEFFHEPVVPCWGVWRYGTAARKHVLGTGDWVVDTHGDDAPLVPTIGWRLVHLAVWTDIYREWTFGVRRPREGDYDFPGKASEAVAWLERAQTDFLKHVRALREENVGDPRPTHYGTKRAVGDLVWDIAIEHTHHGAEIGLLRDLIRGKAREDWYPGPWS